MDHNWTRSELKPSSALRAGSHRKDRSSPQGVSKDPTEPAQLLMHEQQWIASLLIQNVNCRETPLVEATLDAPTDNQQPTLNSRSPQSIDDVRTKILTAAFLRESHRCTPETVDRSRIGTSLQKPPDHRCMIGFDCIVEKAPLLHMASLSIAGRHPGHHTLCLVDALLSSRIHHTRQLCTRRCLRGLRGNVWTSMHRSTNEPDITSHLHVGSNRKDRSSP